MICEFQYQAILQHLSIKQNMGDLQSKPMENFQLKQLQQQYQPFSRGRLIPGDPTFLRLNSIFLKSQYSDALNTRFRTIQRYTLINSISQTQLEQQRALYQYRKANLPCIVQVAYYCFERDNCECMQQGFRATIFTQHVEARLANFKVTKKRQAGIGEGLQWLAPFTIDEGIFVLIGALHAYEVLSQQFTVGCPSPFSIGVNNKSQVKAWINDNWGLNVGGPRKLSENYIIQEIIGLVEDRMNGQFSNILNLAANYMNFTFTGIQELLSKYTINFQRGKQTLQQRLNRRTTLQSGPSAEKIAINKLKNGSNPSQMLTPNNNNAKMYLRSELPTNTQHKPQLQLEKRATSHQSARCSANVQGSAIRNTSVSNNRSTFQSPKKVIKFTYQLSSPKQESNNYIQTLNSSPASPAHYSIGVNQNHMRTNIPFQPMPVGRFPRQTWNMGRGQKISSIVSHEMFDKNTMANLITKKLNPNTNYSANSKSIHPPTPNLSQKRQAININSNIHYNFNRNLQNTVQINPFELSKQQRHQIDLQQQKLKHKSSLALQKTSQNMSITQITEQFKHLLKSQHKIDDQKDILSDCAPFEEEKESLIFQQIEDECFQKQEELDQVYKKSFQEIKEEDEDVSYSVDQYF